MLEINAEESLKLYERFNNIYNFIDDEIQKNGQLSIDVLLLDNNPSDVLNIISNFAPTSFEFLKNNNEINNYFVGYLFKKKKYYEDLSISNEKLGKLIEKSKLDEYSQYPKTDSLYYSEADQEKYLDDILNRLKECINLYFNLYHNKDITILLGDGSKLQLQFLYSNLLHILGITAFQVKDNPELMKALNIKQNEVENLKSYEILDRIIKDIETNKDILCLEMKNRIKRYNDASTGGIIKTQLDPSTNTELLPFDKIDLKTRAFMNSGPYGDVSVISGIADDKYFIRDDKDKPNTERDVQQVRITKTDFNTLKNEKVTIDNGHGDEIQISRGDYVFNGYTNRPGDVRTLRSTQVGTSKRIIDARDGTKRNNIGKFKSMFNGQSPIPVIGVENPDGSTLKIFTPEQQQAMFLSLYYDFSGEGGMNFESYIEILKNFTETFRQELEQQALAKTDSGIIVPSNGGRKK